MRLFDLHCDTLYEMYKRDTTLEDDSLNICLSKIKGIEEYRQVFAVWSQNDLSDEDCYRQFLEIYKVYKERFPSTIPHILAIEGAKALFGRVENLELFYDMGVRFLTLVWAGESVVGGGHDTDIGLSDFGYELLDACFRLGVVPDVSHASDKMFWQVYEEAKKRGKPFVATHSNSRAVHDHKRNLTDDMFLAIKECGGVVGVSLEPTHTSTKDEPTVLDTVEHIMHYISLSGEDCVCLGCDLDGVTRNTRDIPDISCLYKIYDALPHDIRDKVFYENANNFYIRNIKL